MVRHVENRSTAPISSTVPNRGRILGTLSEEFPINAAASDAEQNVRPLAHQRTAGRRARTAGCARDVSSDRADDGRSTLSGSAACGRAVTAATRRGKPVGPVSWAQGPFMFGPARPPSWDGPPINSAIVTNRGSVRLASATSGTVYGEVFRTTFPIQPTSAAPFGVRVTLSRFSVLPKKEMGEGGAQGAALRRPYGARWYAGHQRACKTGCETDPEAQRHHGGLQAAAGRCAPGAHRERIVGGPHLSAAALRTPSPIRLTPDKGVLAAG